MSVALVAAFFVSACGGDDSTNALTGPTASPDPESACTTGTIAVTNRAGYDLLVQLDFGAARWVVSFGSTTFEDVSVGLHRVSWDAAPTFAQCSRGCLGSSFVEVEGCTVRTLTVSP